jgi:hypothetical protein
MTKTTINSQWDLKNFKPLYMSKIQGHPRQIPSKYYHMGDFWDFFQFHRINDDVEYLTMKLFSSTLHGNDSEWYDDIVDGSIKSM